MLRPQTQYFARVKAVDSNSESDYSNVVSIITLPSSQVNPPTQAPSTPLVTNIDKSEYGIQLYINKPLDSEQVTEYKLTLSTSSDFSSLFINNLVFSVDTNISCISLNDTDLNVISVYGLNPSTNYYYKLTASNSIAISGESTGIVTTLSSLYKPDLLGATSITAINATIEWLPVNGATSYRLDVSTNSTFTSLVVNNLTVNSTSYTINALTELTTYYYRVRAYNGTILSDYSEVLNFSTLDGTLTYNGVAINIEAPYVLSRKEILTDSVRLIWYPVENAENYTIDLSTSANFNTVSQTLTTEVTNASFNGLQTGTVYFVRVKAVYEQVSSPYTVFSFTTLLTEPALTAPQLLTPDVIQSNNCQISWLKRSYATNYYIQISTNIGFTSIIATKYVNDIDSFQLLGLVPNTVYFVRVYGVNSNFISLPSTYITFTTAVSPAPISGLETKISNEGVRISWNPNIQYIKYLISVYKSLSDGTLGLISTLLTDRDVGTNTSFLVNSLLRDNTSYKWKVIGITSSGERVESTLQSFTTSATSSSLQLDYTMGVLTWGGILDRLSISTDSDFKFALPQWAYRQINLHSLDNNSFPIRDLLLRKEHLYIKGSYLNSNGTYTDSNTISTLNYHPIIHEPSVTSTSITLKWKRGIRTKYAIKAEVLVGNNYVSLPGYTTIVDLGDVTSIDFSSLTPNTVYRFTLFYMESGMFRPCIRHIISRTRTINNAFTLPLNNTLSIPLISISDIESDRALVNLTNYTNLAVIRVSQHSQFKRVLRYEEMLSSELVLYTKPNTQYFIQAISVNSGITERSAIANTSFTSLPITYSPSNIVNTPSISNFSILNSNEIRLEFVPVSNALNYRVEIAKTSNFSVLDTDIAINYYSNYVIVTGLLPNSTYYARIYAYNQYDVTNYSQSIIINTTP